MDFTLRLSPLLPKLAENVASFLLPFIDQTVVDKVLAVAQVMQCSLSRFASRFLRLVLGGVVVWWCGGVVVPACIE